MMNKDGFWITPDCFMDFNEQSIDTSTLTDEIATRSAAWDWSGMMGLLPDPDPLLQKLGNGAEILEGLTADGHLCGIIQQRKLGTLKKEFRFDPGTDGDAKPTKEAITLRDRFVKDLEDVKLYNLVSAILDTPLYGMTPLEIIWQPQSDHIAISDLRALPARWFGFDEENAPKFISINNPWDGEELPFGKFIVVQHFPTYDNPYGLRLLSRCFWPVLFKKAGIKFWMTFAEKYGMPFLLGKYKPGTKPEDQQEMLDKLVQMVQDAVAVIPDAGSVEILNQGDGKSASSDIFDGIKKAMDMEMSKVIIGQTLTMETGDKGGGSYALGKVHGDVLTDIRQGDEKLVNTAMDDICKIYRNVNAPGVAAPVFKWFEKEDPKKEQSERDKTLKETGVRFKKSYYIRAYNLQDDDFELETGADKPPPAKPADFSESGFQDQDLVDSAIDNLDPADLQKQIEGILAPVIELINQAGSHEEVLTELATAYPDMDDTGLREMLARAIFATEMYGRLTAMEQ